MRWQHAETQAKQADSFWGCGLAQVSVLLLLAQGNLKKPGGWAARRANPRGAGGTEGQRGCRGARAEVRLRQRRPCEGTRDSGRHGPWPPPCSQGGGWEPAATQPRVLHGASGQACRPWAWESLEHEGKREGEWPAHPGWSGGRSWGVTPPRPPWPAGEAEQASLCRPAPMAARTQPACRQLLARAGTGPRVQPYGFYIITPEWSGVALKTNRKSREEKNSQHLRTAGSTPLKQLQHHNVLFLSGSKGPPSPPATFSGSFVIAFKGTRIRPPTC